MPAHTLFPSFVRVRQASAFGSHIYTIPTNQWSPGGGTNDSGTFLAWDATDRDAEAMIVALLTLIADLYPTDSLYNTYTIFSYDDPDSPPTPRFSNGLAIGGGDATPGYSKAVQTTLTFYDTAFNTVKLVCLDAASNNNFDKHSAGDLSAAELAVGVEFSQLSNAWASRATLRPATLLSVTRTLNEKLRRAYKEA